MNHYEVLYIINDAAEEAAKTALIERFSNLVTENDGTVVKVEQWGRKRLAYPIRFMNEGYYVLMTFDADPEFPAELERNLRIASENVLRFMVSRIPEAGEAIAEEDEAPAAEEAAEVNEAAEVSEAAE